MDSTTTPLVGLRGCDNINLSINNIEPKLDRTAFHQTSPGGTT